MGSASPDYNPKASAFSRYRIGMNKGHFIRAILESVSLMIHHNLESLRAKGININVIHILGGASKSRLWNQILADVTGLPVVTLSDSENAVAGACILAQVGVGNFQNVEAACAASVKINSTIQPGRLNQEVYRGIYREYVKLDASLGNYWSS